MRKLDLALLSTMAGSDLSKRSAAQDTLDALNKYGARLGLDRPARLAQYIPQLLHESGSFRWEQEIWGPTAAQKRYEGRKDLGNTTPGDGFRSRGRGPIQLTGRTNYRAFTNWVRKFLDPNGPDFEANPDLVLDPAWIGVAPLFFWDKNKLNAVADRGEVRDVTKVINGGHNGLKDRERFYRRCALTLLGYDPEDIQGFQRDNGLEADNICGPLTRAKLHEKLSEKPAEVTMQPERNIIQIILDALKGLFQ